LNDSVDSKQAFQSETETIRPVTSARGYRFFMMQIFSA